MPKLISFLCSIFLYLWFFAATLNIMSTDRFTIIVGTVMFGAGLGLLTAMIYESTNS